MQHGLGPATLLSLALVACGRPAAPPPSAERTAAYLAALDVPEIERRGTDYTAPRYDPEARLGGPLARIDRDRDYDFDALEELERRLAGVDRARVLRELWARVTAGAADDDARHVAALRFLQRAALHHAVLCPVRRDGSSVSDPLVLLERNEMRCGEVARLAVDLFEAGGCKARTVSFGGHVAAEARWGGAWHYVEVDTCGGEGQTARRPDGDIPSWRELAQHPEWLDALPYKLELGYRGQPRTWSLEVRSQRCFFGEPRRQTYVTKAGPPDDGDYGWTKTRKSAVEWRITPRSAPTLPGAVAWRAVQPLDAPPGRLRARLAWHPAEDADGDLLGYRLAVSARPRGWSYSAFAGDEAARAWWHDVGGWTPGMVRALFLPPPSDVASLETAATEVLLDVPLPEGGPGGPVYVTVFAFDAYHEAAGKQVYSASNELELRAR